MMDGIAEVKTRGRVRRNQTSLAELPAKLPAGNNTL